MPFIPLPVVTINVTEEELESMENLKQEAPTEEDTMWVNSDHITDFCEQENGYVLIFLSNGRNYTILYEIDEFLEVLAESKVVALSEFLDN